MLLTMSSCRPPSRHLLRVAVLLLCPLLLVTGCDRFYYSTMKKFGKEKRDILVNRVKDARKTQEQATGH